MSNQKQVTVKGVVESVIPNNRKDKNGNDGYNVVLRDGTIFVVNYKGAPKIKAGDEIPETPATEYSDPDGAWEPFIKVYASALKTSEKKTNTGPSEHKGILLRDLMYLEQGANMNAIDVLKSKGQPFTYKDVSVIADEVRTDLWDRVAKDAEKLSD